MIFAKNAGVAPTHLDVLMPEEVDAEGLAELEDRLDVSGDLLMRWYHVKY